jgi:glycogen(starch) synthase
MKVRSRASSVMSGASTPGGGAFRSLSEADLSQADAALSHVQDATATMTLTPKLNGAH